MAHNGRTAHLVATRMSTSRHTPPTWPIPAPTRCLAFLQPRRSPRDNHGDRRGRHMSNPYRLPNRPPLRINRRRSPNLRYNTLLHPPVTLPTPKLYRRHTISPRRERRHRRPPTQHSRKYTLMWPPLGVDISHPLLPTLISVRIRLQCQPR